MSTSMNDVYKSRLQRMRAAFINLRTHYKDINWKAILSEVNKNNVRYFKKEIGLSTLKRSIGIGGEKFNKKFADNKKVSLDDYSKAKFFLKAVNAVANSIYHISIEFKDESVNGQVMTDEPQYVSQFDFVLLDENKRKIEVIKTNTKAYDMYYWSFKKGIQKGLLTIDDNNKAELIVNYQEHKEQKLIGDVMKINGLEYINLYNTLGKKEYPLSQFVLREDDPNHNIFFSCYSTASRSKPGLPLSGVVIFHKKDSDDVEQSNETLIKDFATFNLFGKRLNIRNPSFKLEDEIKDLKINNNSERDVFVNSLLAFDKISKTIKGLYEGYLVNPDNKTFENFILIVHESGEIKLIYEACTNEISGYYGGIARLVEDVLILKYDYQSQFRIYRIEMMLNITTFDGSKNEKAFGKYMGFPRKSFKTQVSGKVVILKRSNEVPSEVRSYWKETKSLDISKPLLNKEAQTILKSKKIFDYFKDDFK